MQNKNVELLEFFSEVFTAVRAKDTDPVEYGSSVFEAPSAELIIESETLASLLGGEADLLAALAKASKDRPGDDIATAVALTRQFLEANSNDFNLAEHRTRRLLDFVYPII